MLSEFLPLLEIIPTYFSKGTPNCRSANENVELEKASTPAICQGIVPSPQPGLLLLMGPRIGTDLVRLDSSIGLDNGAFRDCDEVKACDVLEKEMDNWVRDNVMRLHNLFGMSKKGYEQQALNLFDVINARREKRSSPESTCHVRSQKGYGGQGNKERELRRLEWTINYKKQSKLKGTEEKDEWKALVLSNSNDLNHYPLKHMGKMKAIGE